MADTPKRLAGPVALATAPATVYTVPIGRTVVVRHMHIANETSAGVTFTVSIGTDGAGKRLYHQVPLAAAASLDWSGFLVLAAGESLQAYASGAASVSFVASGVEISP